MMNDAMPTQLTRRDFIRSSSALLVASGAPQERQAGGGLTVFSDAAGLGHQPRDGHPESPRRLETVMAVVRSMARDGRLSVGTTRAAGDADLLLVHTPPYLAKVRDEVAAGRPTLSTGDTDLSAGSLAAARAAAGAVISAVDAVVAGPSRRAFCAVRPPGHHASSDRGMGFCIFNNIAIGARHAQRRHGVERVLVADWDVHHGNGTQAVFESDGSVLFFDTHQHPWYPGTGLREEVGTGKGRGLIFNRPFPAGAGRAQVLRAFQEELVPAAARFKPQLMLVSAGFDIHRDDPLGGMGVTAPGFAELMDVCLAVASGAARGRLVAVLEGGYDLDGIAEASAAVVGRMLGRPLPPTPAAASRPGLDERLEAYRVAQSRHWPVLR